jgi:hypothetical protein
VIGIRPNMFAEFQFIFVSTRTSRSRWPSTDSSCRSATPRRRRTFGTLSDRAASPRIVDRNFSGPASMVELSRCRVHVRVFRIVALCAVRALSR